MFAAEVRPGLELRLLEEQHAETVFAAVDRDREYLRPWLPWVDPTQSAEDTLHFIRGARELFATLGEIAAGIWFQDRFIGTIGTHKLDRMHRHVEIGYWIAKAFQGRGFVTEAVRTMMRHAFVELGLNRVVIRCAVGNARSKAIPARLGFTREGIERQSELLHGQYHDLEVWSLLRSEWKDG